MMMTNFPDIPGEKGTPKLSLTQKSKAKLPVDETELSKIIDSVEKFEKVTFCNVEVVFVDEETIVEINKEYLNRNYVTDIISFRYDEDSQNRSIEGTLFCCAPRISEQSKEFKTNEKDEYLRIFIHGLLHLIGYNDKTDSGKNKMTELENRYLQLHRPA